MDIHFSLVHQVHFHSPSVSSKCILTITSQKFSSGIYFCNSFAFSAHFCYCYSAMDSFLCLNVSIYL